MFYCTWIHKDNVYYIKEFETVVIASYEHDIVEIFGVFCKKEVPSLDIILEYMLTEESTRVKLYFTPKEMEPYEIIPLEEEDTLFILGTDSMLLNNQFMFPVLSHT